MFSFGVRHPQLSGARSTQKLVKIHNTWDSSGHCKSFSIMFLFKNSICKCSECFFLQCASSQVETFRCKSIERLSHKIYPRITCHRSLAFSKTVFDAAIINMRLVTRAFNAAFFAVRACMNGLCQSEAQLTQSCRNLVTPLVTFLQP